MIKVQEWAEIRHLHFAEGLSERVIADRVGVARGTVRRALAAEAPPRYERRTGMSTCPAFRRSAICGSRRHRSR